MACGGSSSITLAFLRELSLPPVPPKTVKNQEQTRKTLEMSVLRRESPVLPIFRPLLPAPSG
jgi:hypothetical protein